MRGESIATRAQSRVIAYLQRLKRGYERSMQGIGDPVRDLTWDLIGWVVRQWDDRIAVRSCRERLAYAKRHARPNAAWVIEVYSDAWARIGDPQWTVLSMPLEGPIMEPKRGDIGPWSFRTALHNIAEARGKVFTTDTPARVRNVFDESIVFV